MCFWWPLKVTWGWNVSLSQPWLCTFTMTKIKERIKGKYNGLRKQLYCGEWNNIFFFFFLQWEVASFRNCYTGISAFSNILSYVNPKQVDSLMHHKIYSDADVIKMLEYLIDNIFVEFGGRIFQQTIDIQMGTDCAPLLADLFLYSYEAEFVQSPQSRWEKPCTTIQFHLQIYRWCIVS